MRSLLSRYCIKQLRGCSNAHRVRWIAAARPRAGRDAARPRDGGTRQ
jgi:hypothetical protein